MYGRNYFRTRSFAKTIEDTGAHISSCHSKKKIPNFIFKKRMKEIYQNGKSKNAKRRKMKNNRSEDRRARRSENSKEQNSSVYTLNRIANSSKPLQKSFWVVVLLIGLAGFFTQVVEFLKLYYSYPVVVDIESTDVKFLVFPAVTVCNMNSIRKLFASCFEQKINFDECFNANHEPQIEVIERNVTQPICHEDVDELQSENDTEYDRFLQLFLSQNYKSRINYGHQAEDFILSCDFSGEKCDASDFELSVSYYYGNCHTFNSGKQKAIATFKGPGTGLDLELNAEIHEYATFTTSVGARVQVHDPYERNNVDDEGVVVSPGFETNIAITKTNFYRLPPPYKDRCREYDLGESQSECEESCTENITLTECFCSTRKNLREGVPQCDLTNTLVACCLRKAFDDAELLCECPLPCKEAVYNTQLSSSLWPSKVYYSTHKSEFTNGTGVLPYEEVRKSRMRIKVYYDSLDYTTYKQSPMYQSSEFFSQIGGQIGLWLGMSLVAFFEFLEKFVNLCRSKKLWPSSTVEPQRDRVRKF